MLLEKYKLRRVYDFISGRGLSSFLLDGLDFL